MVHHIVLWNLKTELTQTERAEAAARIKRELEAVAGQVSGVVSLRVETEALTSSNRDIGLISAFESEEALQAYQVSPAHKAAAAYIGSVTENRTCLDYETE